MEAAWAIERNPKETGYHAHLITHGEYVPHHRMMELWGGRICYVTVLTSTSADYVTKCSQVAGYTIKCIDRMTHLKLNGGRAVHMSRRFLHGLTSREVLAELASKTTWKVVKASNAEIDDQRHHWTAPENAGMLDVLRGAAA